MKHIFIFVLTGTIMVLGDRVVIAQPTLTAASATPTAGTNVRMLVTNTTSTAVSGTGGANQTWNLSGLAFTRSTDTVNFRFCGSADDCNRYVGTTILSSHSQSHGVVSNYYAGSSTKLSFVGNKDSVSGTSYHHIFTDPRDIMRFPMSYNSGFVDSFAILDTATNGTTTYFRRGNDTVLADGWGTLKTPSGIFTNTLRIKDIINQQDSSRNGLGILTLTRQRYTVFTWYDASHPYPLAQTSEYESTGASVIQISSYADVPGTATGVSSPGREESIFSFAPNPAEGNVTLFLRLTAMNDVGICITDMTGRVFYRSKYRALQTGDNKLALQTKGLAAGLYTVHINTGNIVQSIMLTIK